MVRYNREGKRLVTRSPKPKPPRELLQAIDGLAARHRELERQRGQAEDNMASLRRQLRESDGELGRLKGAWMPWQLARRKRLEEDQARVRARIENARGELDKAEKDIAQNQAALTAAHRAARESMEPADSHTMACPECGRPVTSSRSAPAGPRLREGAFDCAGCDNTWSATWSGGRNRP
jgi:DNA repair exonuclease SbcCD ATPase subunit